MYMKSKKLLSIILSMAILLGIFSPAVIALELNSTQKSLSLDNQKADSNAIIEIEDLRESNVKHFRLPDGSYQAIVYSQAVHRKDENGKWIDIDNHLNEETKDGKTQYSTSDSRIKFVDNGKNYPSMILSEDIYSISMTFIENSAPETQKLKKTTVESKKPLISNAEKREATTFYSLEEAKHITNKTSIRYENFKNSADMEYVLVGNDVKENIILYSASDNYSYEFQLDLTGLIPLLNKDGSISLNDVNNGETKYSIPAPYMYDATGNISHEVTYTIKEISSFSYSLTVCADQNWINSSERVFPITIDPTIQSNAAAQDTYISASNPNTNYGTSEEIWISSSNIAFIKINLPDTIPHGSTITQATLNVPFYYYSSVTSGYINVGAYEILFPWEETEITWNIANENFDMGISTSSFATATLSAANSGGVNNPGNASFNITNLMQYWLDGDPNFGVALKYISGTNSSVILRSWEYSLSAESYYSITYYPLIDITLSSNIMGTYGTQQVNYSTYPSGLTPTWSSSDTAVATVDSNGRITTHSQGTTWISASCYDSETGNTYTDDVYLTVYDSTGIKNDTSYYIMNYSSQRLLSLQSTSDSPHTNVCTQPRSATTIAQWSTQMLPDGKFQLINDHSSTFKCLNVNGTNVDIYTNTGEDSSQFLVERVTTGTYQGLYLIRYGNQYLAQNSSNYNVYVTSSKSAATYWSFMAVEKRSAEFYYHDYTYTEKGQQHHYDTSINKDYFETTFGLLNYEAISYENKRALILYESLRDNDDIFVYRGHGNSGLIATCEDGNICTGRILANSNMNYFGAYLNYYISDFDENQLALNRCVLYIGCSTGTDYTNSQGTYNLVDETFEKGAHFVLGTTESIYTDDGNEFLEYFLDSINEGSNIQAAIEYAVEKLGNIKVKIGEKTDGTHITKIVPEFPIYSVGDDTQYLNIE